MSVGMLGTNCDQCVCMVQCCFTSTETIRLIRDGSPGRPPPLSHSSWALTKTRNKTDFYSAHLSPPPPHTHTHTHTDWPTDPPLPPPTHIYVLTYQFLRISNKIVTITIKHSVLSHQRGFPLNFLCVLILFFFLFLGLNKIYSFIVIICSTNKYRKHKSSMLIWESPSFFFFVSVFLSSGRW